MTTHTLYKCSVECTGCHTCMGGLAFCTVCKGGEASLPTECPGKPMTDGEQHAVVLGEIDFFQGAWMPGHKMDLG